MDPQDLIKAAPEIAKGLTAVGAAIPFTSIVKKMLGPAADELAEMWRDKIRMYRYGNQMRCIEKAEKMAKDAGFTPRAVPPKILFPLLEGASFEDNEDLHTMWAALLANAASPENAAHTRPGFIATLKALSPDEAAILNWMYVERVGLEKGGFQSAVVFRLLEKQRPAFPVQFDAPFSHSDLIDAFCSLGFGTGPKTVDGLAFETCLYNLDSNRLIDLTLPGESDYLEACLTFRGLAFIAACSPPKPRS
jgi:hypothetical protein